MGRLVRVGKLRSWIFVERHLPAGGFNWLVGTFQMETEPFAIVVWRLSHVSRTVWVDSWQHVLLRRRGFVIVGLKRRSRRLELTSPKYLPVVGKRGEWSPRMYVQNNKDHHRAASITRVTAVVDA
jgi:hypothetical protein